jgi:branched-chain amino acid transport system substrate-binding protein
MYVKIVDRDQDGNLYTRLIEEIPSVNQTLGIPEAEYLKLGPISAANPTCEQIREISR